MRRLLLLGFLLGLGATLAAAHFAPWPRYERHPTVASVVTNGGRVEEFVIQLPADRIDPAGSETAVAAAVGDGRPAPRIEHFKLRDVNGNVIGIAAKHTTGIGDATEHAWLIGIPSRGGLVFGGAGAAESIESALAARGWQPGHNADQALSVDLGASAPSLAATGEFGGIEFELLETWVVSGLDADGRPRGTVRLITTGQRTT